MEIGAWGALQRLSAAEDKSKLRWDEPKRIREQEEMGMMNAQGQAESYNVVTEELISERRLWTAVVVKAVEDWRTGTLRARREAQDFLFENDKDLELVCSAAGLDWQGFRARLLRIGSKVKIEGPLALPLAA
jgi:hypothetical protein